MIWLMLAVLFTSLTWLSGCSSVQKQARRDTHSRSGAWAPAPAAPLTTETHPIGPDLVTDVELTFPPRPRSVNDPPPEKHGYWPMELREAIHYALQHSTVLRDLGGTVLNIPEGVQTRYEVAIWETDPRLGPQRALSAFDAQLSTSAFFEKNDRFVNNFFGSGGTRLFQQDLHNYVTELSKRTATGSTFALRNITEYDANNATANEFPSTWDTMLEAEVRQPLLQGAGVAVNRIIGANDNLALANGVAVARVRTDISQMEFEIGIRDYISDVVNAYWDLYYAYRVLETAIETRDASLRRWQTIAEEGGRRGGGPDRQALALNELYRLEAEVQNALAGRTQEGTRTGSGTSGGTFRGTFGVYTAERRLRLMMGAPVTDARLIRPTDEPTRARLEVDWDASVMEALSRRPELKRQRLRVSEREMVLRGSKNYVLPRLDAVGRYRWRGLGKDLFAQGGRNALLPDGEPNAFPGAVDTLVHGDFQEWQLGVEFSVPLGFRRGYSAVQNAEMRLAKERAILRNQEQMILHNLSDAIAEIERAYTVAQTNYNQLAAAETLVHTLEETQREELRIDLDKLLDAQNRLANARSRYYFSMVEYALAIKNFNLEKGSLPDYFDVTLTSGFGGEALPGVASAASTLEVAVDAVPTHSAELLRAQLAALGNADDALVEQLIELLEQQKLQEAERLLLPFFPAASRRESLLEITHFVLDAQLYNTARFFLARAEQKSGSSEQLEVQRLRAKIDVVEGANHGDQALLVSGRTRYEKILEDHPGDLVTINNLIWILQTQLHDSEAALELALEVFRQYDVAAMPPALLNAVVEVLTETRHLDQAESLLREALQLYPEAQILQIRMARVLADSQRDAEALIQIAQALETGIADALMDETAAVFRGINARLTPRIDDPQLSVMLARLFLKSDLYEAARTWAHHARPLVPESQTARVDRLLGDIALVQAMRTQRTDLFEDARQAYARVLQAEPQDWIAANNLVSILADHLHRDDEACAVADRLRDSAEIPEMPERVVETFARIYRDSGRLQRAQQLLEVALNDNPDCGLFHLQLALTHQANGFEQQAIAAARRAEQAGLPPERRELVAGLLGDHPPPAAAAKRIQHVNHIDRGAESHADADR